MRWARSVWSAHDAEETWIMEMREAYIWKYTALGYFGSTVVTCEVMLSSQVCKTKVKTWQSVSQDYAGYLGTVGEEQTASHLIFKCTKWAALDGISVVKVEIETECANVNSATRCREKLG